MSNNPTFHYPIVVYLNGTYIAGADAIKATARRAPALSGHINADLRLSHLDAFLASVNEVLDGDRAIESRLGDIISRLASTTSRRELVISTVIDPATQSMEYRFTIT